jgi:UPF0042 nucleotide-binding protein
MGKVFIRNQRSPEGPQDQADDFFEAEKDVLVRRFKETRRPHPLGGALEESIRIEKERVALLREAADRIIDTSSLTPHHLRQIVTSLYATQQGEKAMTVILISFGFKLGTPQNVDLLFDARSFQIQICPALKP